jgi:uncharacterized protein YuzE
VDLRLAALPEAAVDHDVSPSTTFVDQDPEGEILGIELLAEKIDLSRFRNIELFDPRE